jgi:signal transduction histidine kinase
MLRRFLPQRISGQIALLIVAAIASIYAVLSAVFLLRTHDHAPRRHPAEIEMAATLLDATASADRGRLFVTLAARYPDLALHLDQSKQADWPKSWSKSAGAPEHGFGRNLPPGIEVRREAEGGDRGHRVALRLQDGDILSAQMPAPPPRRGLDPIVITVLSIAVVIVILGLWAARAVTAPLRLFAKAAESFSPSGAIDPLPERGPEEIRTAARALNQMRARIKSLVEDRTRMLIAVSHDLRTPITRLRLASEFLGDASLRRQILRDLDQMNGMVESVLVFLREGRSAREAISIDLASVLQTTCDEFADAGHDVRLEASERIAIVARVDELRRAIANILDNAMRYAGSAVVSLARAGSEVIVTIADDGPGIPDAAKAAMLEPFVRGEPSRHMDGQSGFGLGLSIANAIVAGHGGTLSLHDRAPRGLLVRLAFPIEPGNALIDAQSRVRHDFAVVA